MAPTSKRTAVISNLESQNKPPMLTAGDVTPEVLRAFEKACMGHFQNKDVTADKQVGKIMYSFQDHRIEEWLDTDWDGFAALSFRDFMVKLRDAFLPTGWEDDLKDDILSMRQGDKGFWEWFNSMTTKNLLLKNTKSHMTIGKNPGATRCQHDSCSQGASTLRTR